MPMLYGYEENCHWQEQKGVRGDGTIRDQQSPLLTARPWPAQALSSRPGGARLRERQAQKVPKIKLATPRGALYSTS